MNKPTTKIAATLRQVAELIAAGLPVPGNIAVLFDRIDLQFHHDRAEDVDAWAHAMGAAPEQDARVYGDVTGVRPWRAYEVTGALAGFPVRAWASVPVEVTR